MALNDSSSLDVSSENPADFTGSSEKDAVVTMMDVLQEQADFEDNANAVLGASDDKNCTYSKGYIKRQALYACLTCCNPNSDDSKRAGVCLACSLTCHENHELIELYTKRNFCCDCGNPNFPQPCQFPPERREYNSDNKYNHNFKGIYCVCHRPYPDPDIADDDEEEMIQCIVCEDWLHVSHLEAVVPASEQYSEMICKGCMSKNDFLHDYTIFAVGNEDVTDKEPDSTAETKSGIPESEDVDMNLASYEENPKGSKTVNDEEANEMETNHLNKDEDDGEKSSIKEAEITVDKNTFNNSTGEENLETTASASEKSNENNIEVKIQEKEETIKQLTDTDTEQLPEKNISETSEKVIEQSLDESGKSNSKESNSKELQDSDNLDKDELMKDIKDNTEDTAQDKALKEIAQKDSEESTGEDTSRATTEGFKANDINGSVVTDSTEKKTIHDGIIYDNKTDSGSLEQLKNNEGVVKPSENGADSEHSIRKDDECLNSDSPTSETIKPNDKKSNDDIVSIEDKDEIQKSDENMQSDCDKNEEKLDAATEDAHNNGLENKFAGSSNNDNATTIKESHGILGEEKIPLDADGSIHQPVTTDLKNDCQPQVKGTDEKSLKLESGKRKFSGDNIDGTSENKKTKLNQSFGNECSRPKNSKRIFKGATFWPCNWRKKLCSCSECIFMYKNFEVLFLLDLEDTVTAYEALGEAKNTDKQSQYEKGLQALSSLDRSQQINAITEYNKLKEKLIDFLKKFKEDKTIVKEDDIKRFFANIKPQREPDGVYFCRF